MPNSLVCSICQKDYKMSNLDGNILLVEVRNMISIREKSISSDEVIDACQAADDLLCIFICYSCMDKNRRKVSKKIIDTLKSIMQKEDD